MGQVTVKGYERFGDQSRVPLIRSVFNQHGASPVALQDALDRISVRGGYDAPGLWVGYDYDWQVWVEVREGATVGPIRT